MRAALAKFPTSSRSRATSECRSYTSDARSRTRVSRGGGRARWVASFSAFRSSNRQKRYHRQCLSAGCADAYSMTEEKDHSSRLLTGSGLPRPATVMVAGFTEAFCCSLRPAGSALLWRQDSRSRGSLHSAFPQQAQMADTLRRCPYLVLSTWTLLQSGRALGLITPVTGIAPVATRACAGATGARPSVPFDGDDSGTVGGAVTLRVAPEASASALD